MSPWIQKSVVTCMTVVAVSLALPAACAQQSPERVIPQSDTSFIDSDGTAHVTRVVPVPTTISPEAQKVLARQMSDSPPPRVSRRTTGLTPTPGKPEPERNRARFTR